MSIDDEDPDYKVGYGRPPRANQFKPGTSGNPKGRKKVAKTGRELLNAELARKINVVENGRRIRITKFAAVIRQLVNSAASGDQKSIRNVLEIQVEEGDFDKPKENRTLTIRAKIPPPQHLSPEQLEKWMDRKLIDGGTTIYELPPEPSKTKKKQKW